MTAIRDVNLTVNGTHHRVRVHPRRLLVHSLRDDLGLTGTHVGCETAECGTCVVLMNERAVKSCNLLTVQADGAQITTIEGLAPDGALHPIQQAFCDKHAVHCGFCTPGMIMRTCALLRENPSPNEDEIRSALVGNMCRCTGYQHIVDAIVDASERMSSTGAPR